MGEVFVCVSACACVFSYVSGSGVSLHWHVGSIILLFCRLLRPSGICRSVSPFDARPSSVPP